MISSRVIMRVSCRMRDNSRALDTDESLMPPGCCYCYCAAYYSARLFWRDEMEPERLLGLAVPCANIYSLRAFRVRLMISSLTLSCSESEYVCASLIFSCTSY